MKKLVTLFLALCLLMTLAAAEEYLPIETYKDLDKLNYNACHDRLAELGLPVPVTYAEAEALGTQSYEDDTKWLDVENTNGDIYWQAGYENESLHLWFIGEDKCLESLEYNCEIDAYLYSLSFFYYDPNSVTLYTYDLRTLECVGVYEKYEIPMQFPYPDWLPSRITDALKE